MRSATRRWLAGSAVAGLLVPLAVLPTTTAAAAVPEIVAGYDFEDGTTQGWFGRGDAAVGATTQSAHGGTSSLRTTGRTANWQGPGIQLASRLMTGATYEISGYVRLVTGQPASDLQMTMQRTPSGGSTTWDFIASLPASDAEWVRLSGSYTVPSESSELQLYVETSTVPLDYDIDDVTVTMTAEPPGGGPITTGLATDFEDGTVQGWGTRGGETVANSTAGAHGGAHSLLVSGRTEAWNGPSHSLLNLMSLGHRYSFSVWVRLAAGEPDAQLRMSMERRTGETASYDQVVGNTAVTASGWTNVKGTYTLAHNVDFLSVYIESNGGTSSFHIDDFVMAYVPVKPIETSIPSLKTVLADDFLIGAATGPAQVLGNHGQLASKHFSSITPGNDLKWDATEPSEGNFNFANADAQVDFAVTRGIKVRGHTLVWHSQTPAWVFQDADGNDMTPTPENKALLLRRVERHIRAVVGRYQGRISVWDVANEVVDEGQPDGLRRSKWFEITGMDYIRTAFRVAHEVDPNAKLYLNDYNTELPRKRAAVIKLAKRLKDEGLPIDGVGHQLHVDIEKAPVADIEASIEAVAALGLDNQVTELDVSVYSNFVEAYDSVPADVLAEQGYRYRDLFDAFRRHKAHLSSVTVWGLADDGTWLSTFPITRLQAPLLFDTELQAKPAYWGIVDQTRLTPYTRGLNVPRGKGVATQWALLPPTTVTSAAGQTLRFQLRWNARTLYLRGVVDDPTKDADDAVNVVVGEATYRLPRFGQLPQGIGAHLVRFPGGYRFDADLPLDTGGAVGQRLPFDISLWDAQGPAFWGARQAGQLTLIDPVRKVDAKRATPTIDGRVDKAWAKAPRITTNVQVSGSGGATATARVLWDDTHLYVLAAVTDPTLDASSPNAWEQDSVEIFVNPDNAKTAGYRDDDGQYRINFRNAQSVGGNPFNLEGLAANLTSATSVVPGGYVVEASIRLTTIQPRDGALVGFDLQVNDATAGARTAARAWSDPTGLSYLNTSRWGVLRLVG